jgi:hypothetical protein
MKHILSLIALCAAVGSLICASAIIIYIVSYANSTNLYLQWIGGLFLVMSPFLFSYFLSNYKSETPSHVSLKEDYSSKEEYNNPMICPRCNGSGEADSGSQESGQGGSVYPCEVCGGTGRSRC